MDFEAVCRTCLSTESLNPIFKNKEQHARFSVAMSNTTGLKVELNDGLPQNICIDCMSHINASLKFRARCKDSETKLFLLNQEHNIDLFPDNQKDIKESHKTMKTEDLDETDIFNLNNDDKLFIRLFENPIDKENKVEKIENVIMSMSIIENKVLDIKKLDILNNKTKIDDNEHEHLTEINCNIDNEMKLENSAGLKVKRRVKCRICKKSLSVRSVDAHMSKRHPGADERKVKCELCDTYVLTMKLNRHLRMMHGKDYSICAYCKLEFYTKESLIQHVALCSNKKRRRKPPDTGKEMSECDVCHKKMQKASLKMHQKIKHAGLGPVCDSITLFDRQHTPVCCRSNKHCGRKFGNKFRLNEHLRSKHGYEKYKCAECDFQSASIVAMRNHERRHRGEKPYVCEMCGASFHAAYLLPQHRQSHRTEKPVKCSLCPASFKANNSLHMHKAACHSTATYKCTLCDRAYSCRNYAVKHLRSVHGYSGTMPEFDVKIAS